MRSDFGAAPPDSEHQVGSGMNGRKRGHPHVLEQSQNGELALLIDKGVVGEDGEIEVQGSGHAD